MSNTNPSISGPAEGAGGRPAREAETGRGGNGRWSAKRKASVVLELLRGADLESTSRKYGVTAATLTEWRDAFLAAGAEALKARQEAQLDEQGRRMKLVIAEWPWRTSCGASASGAWRMRSLFCGGGRASEPRPLGLHRSHVRAPLGCRMRGACYGRRSTSGVGGPSARGRPPGAAQRPATVTRNCSPRSGVPSSSRPSMAKATARCGRGCGCARCASMRRVLRLMRDNGLLAPQR
jgi:hypothetical protein